MKVLLPVAPPELLEQRKRTGADRFDEVWEGVYHVAAAPNIHHQDIASGIVNFLRREWAARSGGMALMQVNVSTPERWDQDYRIPDVAVVLPDRRPHHDSPYCQPNVVFEVRSPGDETWDKLDFYAAVGVETVVVVDRDSLAVAVRRRSGGTFVDASTSMGDWTRIEPLGVDLRREDSPDGARLRMRLEGDPATERTIPD